MLYYYLKGEEPSEIQNHYPSLELDEIEPAIAYYHAHQPEMDRYLDDLEAWREAMHRKLAAEAPPVAKRLRARLDA